MKKNIIIVLLSILMLQVTYGQKKGEATKVIPKEDIELTTECLIPIKLEIIDVTATSIQIVWDGMDANLWNVSYSTSSSLLGTVVTTSIIPFNITGLNPDTMYYIRVQASCGKETSKWTKPINDRTKEGELKCEIPIKLDITDVTATSIQIVWDGMGANSWEVSCSTSEAFENIVGETGSPNFNITGLNPGTLYFIKVRARCGKEEFSEWAGPIKGETKEGKLKCETPIKLDITDVTATSIQIVWDGMGANSWEVSCSTSEAFENIVGETGSPNFNITGLNPGTLYFIKVRARCGKEEFSEWAGPIKGETKKGEKSPSDFVTTWRTDKTITVPTTGGGYNYEVDWNNDGVFEQTGITGNVTHSFTSGGTYTIRIRGSFPRIYFNETGDKDKILRVEQWGNQQWTSMERSFYGCSNLNFASGAGNPDLSLVTNMAFMLAEATSFNSNVNAWNTSHVTNMFATFHRTHSFDQPLNNWDVSHVTTMYSMFSEAKVFNQPLNNWITSQVTDMDWMFGMANKFNQDINAWDVSQVVHMKAMFKNTYVYNQPMNNWDTSQVTDMSDMFSEAHEFNQYIGNWDTGKVTTMAVMFNQNYKFNQDIGGWDTSQVTDMRHMFHDALVFNQPLNNWVTSKVTIMEHMFENAQVFDQNLGSWNVTKLVNATNMFQDAQLSVENYDALLIGWDAQNLQPTVPFSGGNSKYCRGESARAHMMNSDHWIITDAGKECPPCPPPVNLRLINKTDTSITVQWANSVVDTPSYWELSYSNNGTTWVTIPNILGNNTSYTIVGLSPSTPYQIRLRTQCAMDDYSEYSNVLNITTGEFIIPSPTGPTKPDDCCNSYKPDLTNKYVISAWVKEAHKQLVPTYSNTGIHVAITKPDGTIVTTIGVYRPSGQIIEGWQRIEGVFDLSGITIDTADLFAIELVNNSTDIKAFFDDVRVFPYHGNLKSFVYDEVTKKLMAELDENNYATFYEYDKEGGLVRVKKETEKGVYTIQETRSSTTK